MKPNPFKKLTVILLVVFCNTACENPDTPPPDPNPIIPDFVTKFLPVVNTGAPENVTMQSAILSGAITDKGGGIIKESGIVISMYEDFVTDYKSPGNGSDQFSISVSQLLPNSTYYYKAYAINEKGTGYGDTFILVTSYGSITDYEGNEYQTVKIADQIWIRENLRSTKYPDGRPIEGVSKMVSTKEYGNHYSWNSIAGQTKNGVSNGYEYENIIVTEVQGVCPTGYHIPSDADWQTLATTLGIPSGDVSLFGGIGVDEGSMLKEAGSKHWLSEGGTNRTGFTALPAGQCTGSEMKCLNTEAHFWSSTQGVCYGFLFDSNQILRRNNLNSNCSMSVRCIKNK